MEPEMSPWEDINQLRVMDDSSWPYDNKMVCPVGQVGRARRFGGSTLCFSAGGVGGCGGGHRCLVGDGAARGGCLFFFFILLLPGKM